MTSTDRELVVLCDEGGEPIGTAPKATVHTADTPLHLAFSSYLRDERGRVLLTRRALGKKTWPGVWTNSCCGHPAPGEATEAAVRRRIGQELGVSDRFFADSSEVLPDFRYWARDSSGVVENEVCPVFVIGLDSGAELYPAAAEVDSWQWVEPQALITAVDSTPCVFSPWMVEQLAHQALRQALLSVP
ncbi:isopentenyl-diphosphate Delta-isomerase [Corynebacterium lowii]|uniref:Isopentenyl-diphosphate Delta-isomerase n=1 Tax=Corynebacterium lowii TaxID=1544413 RepID=A0A0Q1AJA3_9CORY|nr:isopentenyl-diphosphate Delta-isomerase [Corynebacterium lowii]KQB86886.1 Isopentenyl-diphosphate Delta-isomerase [Corynebacterium lowii]MDP9851574.1 isopentenyl-diphosphate delta-isomerase [Corynebacterium lowii]